MAVSASANRQHSSTSSSASSVTMLDDVPNQDGSFFTCESLTLKQTYWIGDQFVLSKTSDLLPLGRNIECALRGECPIHRGTLCMDNSKDRNLEKHFDLLADKYAAVLLHRACSSILVCYAATPVKDDMPKMVRNMRCTSVLCSPKGKVSQTGVQRSRPSSGEGAGAGTRGSRPTAPASESTSGRQASAGSQGAGPISLKPGSISEPLQKRVKFTSSQSTFGVLKSVLTPEVADRLYELYRAIHGYAEADEVLRQLTRAEPNADPTRTIDNMVSVWIRVGPVLGWDRTLPVLTSMTAFRRRIASNRVQPDSPPVSHTPVTASNVMQVGQSILASIDAVLKRGDA